MNYESRHIELKARSYGSSSGASDDTTVPLKRHTRVLSVTPSVDHTSETQLDGWKTELQHLSCTFSQSPLACRLGLTLDVNEFLAKLKGFHTDHASDQKKTYRLWKEWKTHVTYVQHGFEKIEKLKIDSPNDLTSLLINATSAVINRAGGGDRWDALDPKSREPYWTEVMEGLAYSLGMEIINSLPDDEKRSLELFFWAGCSMHKELNSVKGGNTAMMQWWIDNSVEPPVLLANKDNAATIQLAEIVDASAAAIKRAFEVSSQGGIKVVNLAGAIFNHKDEKKGQQDTHRYYFTIVQGSSMSESGPSVSANTQGRLI